MKKLKSTNGFTLVELIVVIAILAILAGIAVPAYSGYIKKAEDAKVVTELDAIKTAAFAKKAENAGEVPSTIEVIVDTDGITYKIDDVAATLTPYYAGTPSLANTSYAKGATWTSTTSKWTPKPNP